MREGSSTAHTHTHTLPHSATLTLRPQVVLGEVAIRHFPRCHGGSLGMPHSGGYPIGLDWKHTKETRSPLHECVPHIHAHSVVHRAHIAYIRNTTALHTHTNSHTAA